MEEHRFRKQSTNALILDQSLNKSSFSVCETQSYKLPKIRSNSIKDSVKNQYAQMRERVFSIQNHKQQEKKKNVVLLTTNEVNELCANSMRYGIMQTHFNAQKRRQIFFRRKGTASIINQQDQKIPGTPDTSIKINSPQYIPINSKFFCHFFDLMNEGKKRLYRERIKQSFDHFVQE